MCETDGLYITFLYFHLQLSEGIFPSCKEMAKGTRDREAEGL